VVTVAGAEREAEILRGEGDAERSRIFAEAVPAQSDFFEFYRSMRAYERCPAYWNNLVLSPNSEFFRFFNSASGGAPSDNQPPPAPVPAAAGALPAPPAEQAPQPAPLPTPPASAPGPAPGSAPVPGIDDAALAVPGTAPIR
jgi:membrane protease subunit HflC